MPAEIVAAAVGAGVAAITGPYGARLTLSVPDDDESRWWTGRPAPGRRVAGTAGIAAVLGALGGLAAGWTALLPAFVWLAALAAPLVVIDFEHHRLPNRLVFAADLGAVLLGVLAAGVRDDWRQLLRAAEGAGAVFLVLFAVCFIAPKAFGYGDVKLGGLLGGYLGWFGWLGVYYGILAGFVIGAVSGLALVALRRVGMKSHLPFGPSLVLGPLIVLAFDLTPSFGT